MTMVTDDLRLELDRQRSYLRACETQLAIAEEQLAMRQANATRCRRKIAELENALALLERPDLRLIPTSRPVGAG